MFGFNYLKKIVEKKVNKNSGTRYRNLKGCNLKKGFIKLILPQKALLLSENSEQILYLSTHYAICYCFKRALRTTYFFTIFKFWCS